MFKGLKGRMEKNVGLFHPSSDFDAIFTSSAPPRGQPARFIRWTGIGIKKDPKRSGKGARQRAKPEGTRQACKSPRDRLVVCLICGCALSGKRAAEDREQAQCMIKEELGL